MSTPITNAEIDQDSPLTSWLLKRLRDNWDDDLCDPPGSHIIKIRSSSYCIDLDYKSPPSPVEISDSVREGELSTLMLWHRASLSGNKAINSVGVARVGTVVRLTRIIAFGATAGVLSGTMTTQATVDIPITNTWVPLWQWSISGHTPQFEVKAYASGTKTMLDWRWTTPGSTSTHAQLEGIVAGLQSNSPDA